jgi:hypothetical protein
VATWEDVRALAETLPETEEGTSYGTPALRVRRKGFARLRDDGRTMAVRVDRLERDALCETSPDAFFVTPHYEKWPWVVVALDAVDPEDLEHVLVEAWRLSAPAKLVASFDAAN